MVTESPKKDPNYTTVVFIAVGIALLTLLAGALVPLAFPHP
jgi:hypothetical protein